MTTPTTTVEEVTSLTKIVIEQARRHQADGETEKQSDCMFLYEELAWVHFLLIWNRNEEITDEHMEHIKTARQMLH